MAGVGRKATLMLASQGAGVALGALGILLIGRYYGRESLGAYLWAMSALGFIPLLSSIGFGEAHVRAVARGVPVERALGVYARLRLGLIGAVGLVGLGLLAFLASRPELSDATTVPILALAFGIHVLSTMRQIAFDTWVGQERVNRPELAKTFETALAVALIGLVGVAMASAAGRWTPLGPVAPWLARTLGIEAPLDPTSAGLALAGAYLVAKLLSFGPVAWWWLRDHVRLAPWDGKLAREYAGIAIPLAFAGATSLVLSYTDVFMVGYFYSDAEAGDYGMAQKVGNIVLLASLAVATPLLPRFSGLLHAGAAGEARRVLLLAERYLLLAIVPIALFIAVLPGAVLHVVASDEYLGGSGALRFLALWAILFTATTPARTKLLSGGNARANLVSGAIGAGLNVPLNLVLIPEWGAGLGATGAALGTLIAGGASVAYIRLRMRSEYGMPVIDRTQVGVGLAGLAAALFWWGGWRLMGSGAFARWWLLALWGLAGAAIFLAVAALLRLVRKDDLSTLRHLASPLGLLREARGKS